MNGPPILWPTEDQYLQAGVQGQMSGTMTWHAPTTENIRLGDTEEWEIWNLSADAHPVHLHLVRFEVVSRKEIIFESMATDDGEVEPGNAFAGDGTYIYDATLVQHDGSVGEGYKVANPTSGATIDRSTLPEYVDTVPLDSVTALPGQITTIRAKFDKPGRFNWHCHILAHEGAFSRSYQRLVLSNSFFIAHCIPLPNLLLYDRSRDDASLSRGTFATRTTRRRSN